MKLTRVEGYPHLARDLRTGAIVNINIGEIDRAKKMKVASQNNQKRVDKIEQDIQEIKSLLMKIIEEKNGNHGR